MSKYDKLGTYIEQLKQYCVKHDLPMVLAIQVGKGEDDNLENMVYNLRGSWNAGGDIENVCPAIVDATFDLWIEPPGWEDDEDDEPIDPMELN